MARIVYGVQCWEGNGRLVEARDFTKRGRALRFAEGEMHKGRLVKVRWLLDPAPPRRAAASVTAQSSPPARARAAGDRATGGAAAGGRGFALQAEA